MSDSYRTEIAGAPLWVHSGTGDVRDIHLHAASPPETTSRNPREQAADELRYLHWHFIDPPGCGEARRILADHRTVFLDGPPGSGRTTAAKMLLWEERRDGGRFRELVIQDREQRSRLDLRHIGEGEQLWLDLSELEQRDWGDVHAELSALRATVMEREADLVVVLPHEMAYDLKPELAQYRVTIEQPPLVEVLRRHLDVREVAYSELRSAAPFLDARPPLGRIPHYVDLIVAARRKYSGTRDFSTWCTAANQAWSGRQGEIADLVAELPGAERALLLATAMLHEAHADGIHHAAETLLRTMEHPADERPMLDRTTLDQRLPAIKAERDPAGRVRFTGLAYDSAIRSYVWAHMPELHDGIHEWVRATVDSAELTEPERRALVRRYTELCLNDRHCSRLTPLVVEWSERSSRLHREAAANVLGRGVRSERCGRYFRRQIYDWSTKGRPMPALIELSVGVCRDLMVVSHPNEALVRLHHFARRYPDSPAQAALLQVVYGDRQMLRYMLDRLTDPDRKQWRVDVDLFLHLIDPQVLADPGAANHALIAERAVPPQLRDGWNRVFAERPYNEWRRRAYGWLARAVEDAEHRDVLIDILVEGADQRMNVLAPLHTMALRPALRDALDDLVLRKIDNAQGLA